MKPRAGEAQYLESDEGREEREKRLVRDFRIFAPFMIQTIFHYVN